MKKTNSGIWWNSILHPDTWRNMDELQKHHVKCKQSKKDHVLWNVQRRQIYIEGTWVSGFLGLEVEGRSGEWLLKVSLRHGEIVLSSVTQSCHSDTAIPWTASHQASLSITNSWSLLKLMSIQSVMPSNHLIIWHPLFPPSIFPSIRVFSNESVLHIRWPNYWSFNFRLSNEYSGPISFRIDRFDLLSVQGTLQSLLQYHSSKA